METETKGEAELNGFKPFGGAIVGQYLPTATQALMYEVHSSLWASWISWGWAQELAAKYFAWKVNRKMRRIAFRQENMRRIREYLYSPNAVITDSPERSGGIFGG
jgi:hypothetical protein